MKTKSVLGRGLDALIRPVIDMQTGNQSSALGQMSASAADRNNTSKIPIAQIEPNPFQPRLKIDPEALEGLKQSIIKNGLIQPITVRKIAENKYQIISGERRYRAFQAIGYIDIPAYILGDIPDDRMLALALIENIQREDLNPIEIAQSYKRLLEECNLTQEEIANSVGKDRTTISNSIRLLKLPWEIQSALIEKKITIGHARALINLLSTASQLALLKRMIAENLSVRQVEILAKKAQKDSEDKKKIRRNTHPPASNISLQAIEDSLKQILGTKVLCRADKSGQGSILIEFYSKEEFERLIELLYEINKY